MKSYYLTLLLSLFIGTSLAQTQEEMALVYVAAQTPYKYGLVVAPKDGSHMTDCPTVFRMNDRWYMTYVIFDGKGYETWMSESDDLLHWREVGCVLPFREDTWDKQQRAGFPALTNWEWGSTHHELGQVNGKYWMSYFGGENKGYEAQPLSIGMAYTDAKAFEKKLREGSKDLSWEVLDAPVLSPKEKSAQWWETGTHYKPLIYRDSARTLGYEYLLYYNAYGKNPESGLGAERIGLALSNDMTHWTRYKGNPVFNHDVKGTITGDAQIVKFREESPKQKPLYVMFYFRAFDPNRSYLAYNTFSCSYDLIHWEDWQGPDLIYPSEPYDDQFAHKTFILRWKGVVYHFYCAVDRDNRRGIAVATSRSLGQSDVHFDHPFRFGDGFSDRAVLQAGAETVIWGEAAVGSKVEVQFGKTVIPTITDGHGIWQVKLPMQKPSLKPMAIEARCGDDCLRIKDVVFGDVWFAAGTAVDTAYLQKLGIAPEQVEIRLLTSTEKGEWNNWKKFTSQGKVNRVIGILSAGINRGKVKSWSTPTGKWVKKLLNTIAPYSVKGLIWYDGDNAATDEDMNDIKQLFESKMGSSMEVLK